MDNVSYIDSVGQARLEQIRLEFTVTLVDTAWAFARSAQTLYGSGSPNAGWVASKAQDAFSEAASQLSTLSVDHRERDRLNDKLDQIHVMLEGLLSSINHKNQRKLRAVSKKRNG